MNEAKRQQIEFGDFQTPADLAEAVCRRLKIAGVRPDTIVEPTCGAGAFLVAAGKVFPSARSFGLEVNGEYAGAASENLAKEGIWNAEVLQADFFTKDWKRYLEGMPGRILVLGNPPWVTNAQIGAIGGTNLPVKTNFQRHAGFDAITGKSNFDISEWMLIHLTEALQGRNAYLAMLCKTAVARKLLMHIHKNNLLLKRSHMAVIDAKEYFQASVDACLLFCEFDESSRNYDYEVFSSLDSDQPVLVGHRAGVLVSNVTAFEETREFFGDSVHRWRSGLKHDCSSVMEMTLVDGVLRSGLGESVDIESTHLYPLLKGSDVANDRVAQTNRYVLVTQSFVGEDTSAIAHTAPKTWAYLERHSDLLDARRSKIYESNPRFSVFGVGPYTFQPWKVAICGLYKTLRFSVVGPIGRKPVVFDDTVYFLGFQNREGAEKAWKAMKSRSAQRLLQSLVFLDEKRPVKSAVLNKVNLDQLIAKTE